MRALVADAESRAPLGDFVAECASGEAPLAHSWQGRARRKGSGNGPHAGAISGVPRTSSL